jgi:hypothetical protein
MWYKLPKKLQNQYVKDRCVGVKYGMYVYICIWDVLSVLQVLIVKMLQQSIKIFLKIYKIFENV